MRQFGNKTKEETLYDKAGRLTGDRYRYLSDNDKNDGNRYFYLDEGSYKTTDIRYRGERTQIIVNGTMAAQGTTDYGAEYFTTDLLGSISTVTNTHGNLNTTYTYDVFGSLVQGELTGTTDFGYLGKQHDQTAKLYNYGYRDYKSQAARFTTIDPIRDGFNWFSYVNNDPVNFIDLWGLEHDDSKVNVKMKFMKSKQTLNVTVYKNDKKIKFKLKLTNNVISQEARKKPVKYNGYYYYPEDFPNGEWEITGWEYTEKKDMGPCIRTSAGRYVDTYEKKDGKWVKTGKKVWDSGYNLHGGDGQGIIAANEDNNEDYTTWGCGRGNNSDIYGLFPILEETKKTGGNATIKVVD